MEQSQRRPRRGVKAVDAGHTHADGADAGIVAQGARCFERREQQRRGLEIPAEVEGRDEGARSARLARIIEAQDGARRIVGLRRDAVDGGDSV